MQEVSCLTCKHRIDKSDNGASDNFEDVVWCGLSKDYIGYLDEASKHICNKYEGDCEIVQAVMKEVVKERQSSMLK